MTTDYYQISCATCSVAMIAWPDPFIKMGDVEQANAKFLSEGWRIGDTSEEHRCPTCLSEEVDRVVICPYCGVPAKLVDSLEVYGRSYGMIWLCRPCDAYVGVHFGHSTYKPLGTLAKKELRRLRQLTHQWFDPLWELKMKRDNVSKHEARRAAYEWLAEQLGISLEECHIGMFNEARCKHVIRILKRRFF